MVEFSYYTARRELGLMFWKELIDGQDFVIQDTLSLYYSEDYENVHDKT